MADPGLEYLLGRVGLVESGIRSLVAHQRADDPAPDDPFRGLYVTDEAVDRLLSISPPWPGRNQPSPERTRVESAADQAEQEGAGLRLRDLHRRFELTETDVELLIIAMIPDLDSRFERLYGYLNDDVTRRRATIGLALSLVGASSADAGVRARLAAGAPLVDRGLVLVEEQDRPFLTRALRVPDRVTRHLLGDDLPDTDLADLVTDAHPVAGPEAAQLGRAVRAGQQLCYLRETLRGSGAAVATAALAAAGRPAVTVDLQRLAESHRAAELVRALGREAGLTGAGVVAGPVEALSTTAGDSLRRLAGLPVPVLLIGGETWDPGWCAAVPLIVDAPALTADQRAALWRRELAQAPGERTATLDPDVVTQHFVLGPAQVSRAVRSAAAAALLTDTPIDPAGLRRGALAQNAAGLERLARRVEPRVGWPDLVLPDPTLKALQEVSARARHRDLVLTRWRMRPGGARGRGVTALFAGDSGTGKTMAAEVIAADLGLDLYTVNLATVVDKYVGETEKNLERIFSEAGGVNAVLLFDEADAIFGKRSEVRDAHDRYANIESAYLLQRLETFDGLAVLSTNLRANIDEAFTRRLDAIIDFPAPDENARSALWQRCLTGPLPVDGDLDLDFCARSFTLSGGNIRSAAITAAYLAAANDRPVSMADLIAAVQQEYRKLGRLVLEREFGPYLARSR